MLYTYKVVLDHRDEFSEFLLEIARDFSYELNLPNKFINIISEILKFQNSLFIKLTRFEY